MKKESVLIAEGKAKSREHKKRVDEKIAQLLAYTSDSDKPNRKSAHLCKYCHYVDTYRIGGSAITDKNCDACGEAMTFASTCTNKLCHKCSEKLNLCKRCGQRIE